jgi:hypothetical protein
MLPGPIMLTRQRPTDSSYLSCSSFAIGCWFVCVVEIGQLGHVTNGTLAKNQVYASFECGHRWHKQVTRHTL